MIERFLRDGGYQGKLYCPKGYDGAVCGHGVELGIPERLMQLDQ